MDQVLQVLQVLRIKGRATPETLATAIGVEADRRDRAVRAGRGWSRTRRSVIASPTSAGERVDELYASERTQAGAVIDDMYETFLPINDEVKQIVTDWQMRDGRRPDGAQRPRDRAHDDERDRPAARRRRQGGTGAGVADRGATALRLLLPPAATGARRIRDGDHTMVAAPIKDSYHTVWFELHEDLLLLSGPRAHGGLSLSCSRGSAGPPTRCRPDRGTR